MARESGKGQKVLAAEDRGGQRGRMYREKLGILASAVGMDWTSGLSHYLTEALA